MFGQAMVWNQGLMYSSYPHAMSDANAGWSIKTKKNLCFLAKAKRKAQSIDVL